MTEQTGKVINATKEFQIARIKARLARIVRLMKELRDSIGGCRKP